MGFVFECDACADRRELSSWDLSLASVDLPRTCQDCGQDGCVSCIPDEVCSACQDKRERYLAGEDVDSDDANA